MKRLPLLPLLAAFVALTVLTSAVRASVARIEKLDENTFVAVREAPNAFSRDVDALIAAAKEDAANFCAARDRQPKILSIEIDKPWPTLGYPKATVKFVALEAGDPALAEPAPEPVFLGRKSRKAKKAEREAAAAAASPTDALYGSLMKLDELRQKGILTEEEFQAEKQKVLNRSK